MTEKETSLLAEVHRLVGSGLTIQTFLANGDPDQVVWHVTYRRFYRDSSIIVVGDSTSVGGSSLAEALERVLAEERRRDERLAALYRGNP